MWSGAGYVLLAERCPHLGIQRETLSRRLQNGFPWHHPERDHTELATPDAWWDAVDHRFADAFVGLGWGYAHRTRPFVQLRERILEPRRHRVFDDVEPVLSRLRDRGWRHVIVSNHVPELPDIVTGLGIREFFADVVSSGLVGYEKPHDAMFVAALRCAIPGAPIWMIGDNPECDCHPVGAFGANAILVRAAEPSFERHAADLWQVARLITSSQSANWKRPGGCEPLLDANSCDV